MSYSLHDTLCLMFDVVVLICMYRLNARSATEVPFTNVIPLIVTPTMLLDAVEQLEIG